MVDIIEKKFEFRVRVTVHYVGNIDEERLRETAKELLEEWANHLPTRILDDRYYTDGIYHSYICIYEIKVME